ncbi:unnamed protein product [Musa banksii]
MHVPSTVSAARSTTTHAGRQQGSLWLLVSSLESGTRLPLPLFMRSQTLTSHDGRAVFTATSWPRRDVHLLPPLRTTETFEQLPNSTTPAEARPRGTCNDGTVTCRTTSRQ